MSPTTVLWPMIAHVALVYAVYVLMFFRRRAAVTAGHARVSQFRENRDEPLESLFVRNNLANQFELPVLFHAACLALAFTDAVSPLALLLAWLFVASRYLHAAVHVTSNRIRHRSLLFTAGFLVLGLMWLLLTLRLADLA